MRCASSKIADIDKNLRFDRMKDSFTWLWKAGVALPVYNTTEPSVPLMLNEKSALFKLFMSDVGLLTTVYGKAAKLKIMNQEKDINKGAIYENVVAQELTTHGFPLYYYNSKKRGELDFLIEYEGKVLPVEVKSGKNYEKHSALSNVLRDYGEEIPYALVLSGHNGKVSGKTVYMPIYMIMFLQPEQDGFVDISAEHFGF